jgi:hypothetical protein
VATASQIKKVLSRTIGAIGRAPLLLIAVQVPEAAFDLVDKTLTPITEKYPMIAIIGILPIVWLLSALSVSLTFAAILRLESGEGARPTLRGVCQDLSPRLGRLLGASLLNGIVVLCGLLLLLPGIYFMAIYLFVPQLVMTLPAYPATTYLSLSKKLVRDHFWSTLGVVLILFVADFGLYVIGETLGTWLAGTADEAGIRDAILVATKILLSLVTSTAINVGVSYFFLEIRDGSSRPVPATGGAKA